MKNGDPNSRNFLYFSEAINAFALSNEGNFAITTLCPGLSPRTTILSSVLAVRDRFNGATQDRL